MTTQAPYPPTKEWPTLREAEAAIPAGFICARCETKPRAVKLALLTWQDGFGIRCSCQQPLEPSLVKAGSATNEVQTERLGRMVNRRMVERGVETDMLPAIRTETIATADGIGTPMTIESFKQRQELMKYVVSEMVDGVHYGLIPGTHDKSLWEPGAEYLRAAFGIRWDHVVVEQREIVQNNDYYYRVVAKAYAPDGSVGASWEGSAWSKERRFYCKSACPKPCPQDHPPRGMEQEMLPHNVRDRAIKRAFVALIRNVTGATGYFKDAVAQADAAREDAVVDVTGTATGECPEHGVEWRDGKFGPFHPIPGGGICDEKKLINAQAKAAMGEAAGVLGWDNKKVAAWIKETYGQTWSNLSNEDKVSATEALKALASKSATDASPPQGEAAPAAERPADDGEGAEIGAQDAEQARQAQMDEDREHLYGTPPNGAS